MQKVCKKLSTRKGELERIIQQFRPHGWCQLGVIHFQQAGPLVQHLGPVHYTEVA